MPASDKYWHNLPTMHKVFAGSALVLFVSTVLMMAKDHDREWRDYQKQAEAFRLEKIQQELAAYDEASFQARLQKIEDQIKAADSEISGHQQDLEDKRQAIRQLEGKLTLAERESKFQNAARDVARSKLDIATRDGVTGEPYEELLAEFVQEQTKADQLVLVVEELKAELDQLKGEQQAIEAQRIEAETARKQLLSDRDRLVELKEQLEPSNPLIAFKRTIKEWPILDGFNPHLKIQYEWPSLLGSHLEIQLGMARVERVDRCRTCHVNINEFAAGNMPVYPHGEREGGGYPHPFSSHPHPDLFLTSASPHPIEKFGCTICHEGDGSGTEFQTAEHTPTDPAQGMKWHKEFGWHANHFWEYPMHPSTMVESSCIRCHHQVTELGVNEKFGATAPKVFEGYELVKQFGCYGCHQINGYDGTKPIGPDLRLEPQTPEEALAIAADPNQTAGTLRKVGPSLRHVGVKTTAEFIAYWTELPSRFRPDTRMPQFFDLSNQQDELAKLLQPVELAGIAAYLTAKSEPLELKQPKDGYQPDAARGKALFAQRGCLACHSHDDEEFSGIKQTFGPNLSKIHEKIKPGPEGFNWLYTWLNEPTLHHPRTRMPNLFLTPEGEGDQYVDPAADIAAFLLAGGPKSFPKSELPGPYLGLVVGPGAKVEQILPGSPAVRAKASRDSGGEIQPFLVGDVITAVGETTVNSPEAYHQAVAGLSNGQSVTVRFQRGGRDQQLELVAATPLDDLVRLYLGKALSRIQLDEVFEKRQYPVPAAAWTPKADGSLPDLSEFITGDEIELAPVSAEEQTTDEQWAERKLQYIGRRAISRYGCYACHDIPGFEQARPIGTALQDWGRKDTSKLAVEHIEEWLHHHGEPDGSSTAEIVQEIVWREYNDGTASEAEKTKAFFYNSLLHHGRPGFIWQKLRQPRSYDYRKTETKGWDERLRMPKFPLQPSQIEAIATFVLGLVADPPEAPYIYNPDGPAGAIIRGEKLLAQYNCTACHILEMPAIEYEANVRDFVGITRAEIVEVLTALAKPIIDGQVTQAMLRGEESLPEGIADERVSELISGMATFITNCETLLDASRLGVDDLTKDIAPLLARLSQSSNGTGLQQWLDDHPETLIADPIGPTDYADAVRLALKLKPPRQEGGEISVSQAKVILEAHGLMVSEYKDEDYSESSYDLWENLEVGGRYKLSGINARLVVDNNSLKGKLPGRGGEFMIWLYNKLALEKAGGEPSLVSQHVYITQQASPPPLYREGVKVQTPWLYQFLKNPEQLRYTTVLRMPRFNMSEQEAQDLANYFAAKDGVPYPYQLIERTKPGYLTAKQAAFETAFPESSDDYLTQSWKLLNANQCIKCHSVGGRKYQAGGQLGPDGQPQDIQGPNLKRVQRRLRPDWVQLWVYNPKWITPYTSMPANLPRNQQNFPGLFGADGHWQNQALVDALMNYANLLERLGVTVYDPKKAEQGADKSKTPPPESGGEDPAKTKTDSANDAAGGNQ